MTSHLSVAVNELVLGLPLILKKGNLNNVEIYMYKCIVKYQNTSLADVSRTKIC